MQDPFHRPLILGHRGAPFDAPENTLRSFARALEQGADGVELDVRRARDGVPVVIHDDTLDRTTPARGRVADHAWPALERLTGAELPSLQQAAAWAAASGAWLNVEIKSPGVEAATLAVLRETKLLDRAILSSFHPQVVAEVGRSAPEARRYLLTEEWDEAAQEAVAQSGAQGVCLRVDAATPLALEVLRNDGLPVVVWTVDAPARIRELLLAGVAAIITNRPRVAAEVRAETIGAG
jgi:glycerophosphoryl diester phosphodiesterase